MAKNQFTLHSVYSILRHKTFHLQPLGDTVLISSYSHDHYMLGCVGISWAFDCSQMRSAIMGSGEMRWGQMVFFCLSWARVSSAGVGGSLSRWVDVGRDLLRSD